MKIEKKQFMFKGEQREQTILIPDNGMVITQKTLVEDEMPIFSKMVFLGSSDTPNNYVEITDIEAEKRIKVEEEKSKERRDG